jgi:Na+/proline symporter
MTEKNRGALLIVAPLVVALIIVCIIYDPFHMISSNPENSGRGFANTPVWLWVIGVGILGSVMSYGISQARRRTRTEANITQDATDELYRREESSRERKGLP